MQTVSRLTRKYQATIPRSVRSTLGLKGGDSVVFSVRDDGTVLLTRATPLDVEFLRALSQTLSEWASPEDEEDYRGL